MCSGGGQKADTAPAVAENGFSKDDPASEPSTDQGGDHDDNGEDEYAPRRQNSRIIPLSSQRKSTFKQINFVRRLQQAIEEGARAAVLRTAVAQARAAGVESKPTFAAVLLQGDALIPLIDTLECAFESGNVTAIRDAIAQADAGGATAHVEAAKAALQAVERRLEAERELLTASCESSERLWAALQDAREAKVDEVSLHHFQCILDAMMAKEDAERRNVEKARIESEASTMTDRGLDSEGNSTPSQAESSLAAEAALAVERLRTWEAQRKQANEAAKAMEEAIKSRSVDQLRSAIDAAKLTIVSPKLIAHAEEALERMIWQESMKEQLQLAERELRDAEGSREALDAAIVVMQQVLDEALAGGFPAEDAVRWKKTLAAARAKQRARAKLAQVIGEVDSLDPRTCATDLLVDVKTKMFVAVEAARGAGLSEAELATPEKLRRLLHNAVEDRKGAVRLYCRVRPLIHAEIAAQQTSLLHAIDSFSLCVGEDAGERDAGRVYSFDACWMPGSQEEVFEDTKDLVQSAVDGYNVTIFAYGQTGAGKTYTMYGGSSSAEQGVCPRAAEELFSMTTKRSDRWDFVVTLSMLELYSRRFYDLLDLKSQKNLKIRTASNGEVFIENACEKVVQNAADVKRLVDMGTKERRSRDTQMNLGSSRSHLFFCLKVSSANRETGQMLCGKMMLVDLAGSERVRKSGVTGDGLREACEINTSLSALSDVLQALVRGEGHVPYRNHELTQALQDSLGGTAKTLMFVNLSPAAGNLEESLMSLKYAQRAKGVVNEPTLQVTSRSVSKSSAASPRVGTSRFTPRPRLGTLGATM